MNAQVLIAVSAAISALATIVIAVLAGVNYRLSKNINETNENFKKQQAQLLIAIATSNIIAGSDSPGSQKLENKVKQFNKWNKGGLELELPT